MNPLSKYKIASQMVNYNAKNRNSLNFLTVMGTLKGCPSTLRTLCFKQYAHIFTCLHVVLIQEIYNLKNELL